jgi:hypothetical protein
LEEPALAILKDFINQVTFPEVWALLSQGNDEMAEYESAYQEIFQGLSQAQPQENTAHMTIRFVMEEPMWEFYFDDEESTEEADEPEGPQETLQVYGFIPGDKEGYAIGLKPPETLVGLDVDPETVRDYSPVEIVAHCLAEMTYTSTVASSAYGMEKDMAGGGLLASQTCMQEDIQNIDLDKLRQELGVLPKPQEDYKEKYGFLF